MQLKVDIKQQGFSLVEMAIVIVILGFVIGALLLPLQVQRNQLAQSQTENTLELAKKALLGYAQANGRLPCPATALSNTDAGSLGQESPVGGTHSSAPVALSCTVQVGYLPAATLGLQPIDSNGFAIDAWNNRIRYAVAESDSSAIVVNGSTCGGDIAVDFTTSGNMGAVGLACLMPELRVCATSTAANCTASINLINNAIAVIYSVGTTGADASGGADETENLNVDANFVSHEPRSADDPNGEFDHIVTWISPYVLYNAMIEAGQLH